MHGKMRESAKNTERSSSSIYCSPPILPALLLHESLDEAENQQLKERPRIRQSSPLNCCHGLMDHLCYAKRHPLTVLGTFFLFVVMLIFGLYLSYFFKGAELEVMENEAMSLAEETALFFASQLDAAVLPLFSLAHFVSELAIFAGLENAIGYEGDPDALPMISETHRNVTGVCDDQELVNRFNKIAETLKSTANMDGILVNLQLVPDAVVCLTYPLNNTEDFPHGMYLDSSGAIGHDLLADPARKTAVESALTQSKMVITGPLTLFQCPDCNPAVREAFIARLPINSLNDKHVTAATVNQGNRYGKWGFAVAIINWENLVTQSGVRENFGGGLFEFQLTRTDRTINETTGQFEEDVVLLAESAHFAASNPKYRVHTALPTNNNEWEISVAYYTCVSCLKWFPWAVTASVLVSFFISMLVYTIFMQKQRHSDAIEEKSRQIVEAAKRSARNERELNDFIAQYVWKTGTMHGMASSFSHLSSLGTCFIFVLQM
jgi:sensor domain CHASE-containing protein